MSLGLSVDWIQLKKEFLYLRVCQYSPPKMKSRKTKIDLIIDFLLQIMNCFPDFIELFVFSCVSLSFLQFIILNSFSDIDEFHFL